MKRAARANLELAPADAWSDFRGYRAQAVHRIVGLMTGTSADGLDAAMVLFEGPGSRCAWRVVAHRGTPLPPELRTEILEVASAKAIEPERLMRLDAALGEAYAAAVLELCAAAAVPVEEVDAIGCHGQTLRHLPRSAGEGQAFTWQAGSAAILAERTGRLVVSNFRARDTAAGGEGAPLVPFADWCMFRSAQETRALLNIGGIANITVLPCEGGVERVPDVIAFDTGPGNMVLDGLMGSLSQGRARRDEDGARAAAGTFSLPLLDQLMVDPFFQITPPRSTGREHFGGSYVERMLGLSRSMELRDEDVLATAVELTAASVAQAIEQFVAPQVKVDALYVSGGGAKNPTLVAAIGRRIAPIPVRSIAALGIEPEVREAAAFALLAHLSLSGEPGNVPAATGAARPVVLGQLTPGRGE